MFNLFKKYRIAKLARARSRAFLAHRDAMNRGDTREIHHTRAALITATNAILRAEIGR
jgi:hypothetical protein